MHEARHRIAACNVQPDLIDTMHGVFDDVWQRSATKTDAVASAIADALCGLASAGQQSSERLTVYAESKAFEAGRPSH
jgi:hypothetical protein